MLDLKEFESFGSHIVNGYIVYYIPDHHLANKSGEVYQHMIAAEQMLGRRLRSGEVVHHKDENRLNNSVDNLMVFKTKSDHSAYHQGRDIVLDGDVYMVINKHKMINGYAQNECPLCGELKDTKANMCRNCRNKENSKHIPEKEELINLLLNNNMCAIGRMYGVSDNAIRKWCKKYDLPFRKKEIEKFRNSQLN